MSGFELHLISIGDGKGVATYFKPGIIKPDKDIKNPGAQITFLTSAEVDVVNIYRSHGMNNKELAESLKGVLNPTKFTMICGDLNLCYIENRDNEVTRMLEQNGFAQLVHAATHFKGGHIDHVYSNHKAEEYQVDIKLYSPYYLADDHDAILITIKHTPGKEVPHCGKYATKRKVCSLTLIFI